MQHILAVGVGGFFGAIARHVVTGIVHRRYPGFTPAGTLVVNVAGCLMIGVLMALVIERKFPMQNETLRLLLITGFIGGMTTFSAFGYETVALLDQREIRLAFFNVAANLVLGFSAVWLGLVIGRLAAG